MQTLHVPAFRLRQRTRHRINQSRFVVDVIGLTTVKLFSPWLWRIPWLHPELQIYPILATFVILTVKPSRLPEFTTTRLKQRQAWRRALVMLPCLAMVLAAIAWATNTPMTLPRIGVRAFVASLWFSYCSELFWRNILQPELRHFGLGRSAAIILQAILFALSYAIAHQPAGVVLTALVLGAFNGWLSYRYRTLWPGFVLLTTWTLLFL